MAHARWWSMLMVLTGCAPKVGVVATLEAPAGSSWRTARLQTAFAETSGGGGHGFGGSDHEMSAVELVFDDRPPIVLESAVRPAPMFWEPKPIRQLVKGPFVLAVSPDGSWVAYSGDGGAQWRLVEPVTGFSCLHLVLPGPLSTLWSRVPTPALMAVEVLSFEAREKGPLGLNHQFAGDWPNHPLVSEGAAAAELGKAHAGEPAIAAAALQAFIELSPTRADGLGASLAQIVTAAARADPSVRRQLEALFDDYSIDHVSAVMRAAGVLEVLGETTTEQKLARWVSILSGNRAAVEAAFHQQVGADQGLAALMWGLARRSFAKGAVDELVRQAAKDWLVVLQSRLRARKLAAYETDVEPWSESYSEQVMASYAVMVLGLAGEREFLLTMPRKKQVTPAPWPPTFARGSSFDARVKEGEGPEFVSVSAWLAVATDHAAVGAR